MDKTSSGTNPNRWPASIGVDFRKTPMKVTSLKNRTLLVFMAFIISALVVLNLFTRYGSPDCFAVDNEQHLFLCYSRNLYIVFQDKVLFLKRFSRPIYDISVTEDNHLGVESGDQDFWFDLNQSQLEQRSLDPATPPNSATDSSLGGHSEMVMPDEQNGARYSLTYQHNWFRYSILKSSDMSSYEVFYTMPLSDLVIGTLVFLLHVALLVCGIVMITCTKSRKRVKRSLR